MAGKTSQYSTSASSFAVGDKFDVSKQTAPGVYDSQKYDWSVMKAYMLSENIQQISAADLLTLATGAGMVTLKQYYIDDANSGDRLIIVRAATPSALFQEAIDIATGEISTYDLSTDTFVKASGVYTPTFTPDGTVCTSGTAITNSATFSKVGNICTVMLRVKGIDLDFSAGPVGTLTVDTFPITPTTPNTAYGTANISILDGSLFTNASEFRISFEGDIISFWCLDTAFIVSGIEAIITMQYRIS